MRTTLLHCPNSHRSITSALLLFCGGLLPALGQKEAKSEPPSPDPFVRDSPRPQNAASAASNQVAVPVNLVSMVEFIQIDHADLVPILSVPGDGVARREAVGELVAAGKATLLDMAAVCSVTGQRARSRSIRERIAATELDPADDPEGHPIVEGGKSYWPPAAQPHPTAWQFSNVGTTVEIEPFLLEEARHWRFSLGAEMVEGFVTDGLYEVPQGWGTLHQIPLQTTSAAGSATQAVEAALGAPVLVAVSPVPRAPGEPTNSARVITFVRGFASRSNPDAGNKPTETPKNSATALADQWNAVLSVYDVETERFARHLAESSDRLHERIRADVENGSANLVDIRLLPCSPGQNVSTVDNRQFTYATEFDPPQVPNAASLGDDARDRYWPPSAYPNPTTFQIRMCGLRWNLNLAGAVDGGTTYQARFEIEQVAYVGKQVINELATPRGMEPLCVYPVFVTLDLVGAATGVLGQPVFLGAASEWKAQDDPNRGRKRVFFLRIDPA